MAPSILCIVGKKKSGKTTFIEKLVPALKALGLSVGTVKHDAHSFEMDHEGKDSWRHRHCGADSVVVSSPQQVALIKSVAQEMTLPELALEFFADRQIVVAEGYFRSDQPRIEVHRGTAHAEPLSTAEKAKEQRLLAVVSDVRLDLGVPLLGLDQAEEAARLVARELLGL